ncbi:MAG: hypothetical protein IGS03_11260 [Candidatus Sericytochromatia bacterium]|nr:hypothetical protein [Candidatus Sericytochromatia bacterium]
MRSIPAILSEALRFSLTPASSLFWAGVFVMATASTVSAETPVPPTDHWHFWAESLAQERGWLFAEEQIRLFGGEHRLLAHQLRWHVRSQTLEARGQVLISGPEWELKAEAVDWLLPADYLVAQQTTLHYRQLLFSATEAQLQPQLWQFEQLRLEGLLPWPLQIGHAQLLPQTDPPQLRLEQIQLPGLNWAWPLLVLELGPPAEGLEIRPPLSALQPELNWGQGGLQGGISSQLWRDSQQRLYGWSRYQPQQGWQQSLAYEWRPDAGQLLNLELGLQNQSLQGRGQYDWRSPWGLWLRSEAQWQGQDNFWTGFWLPELQPRLQHSQHLAFWLASEPQQAGPVNYRYLAGGRWPAQELGLSVTAESPLIHWSKEHQLWSSGYLNLLYSQNWYPTTGLRLIERWLPDAWPLEAGFYAEQYLSGLPEAVFVQPRRLQPWSGAYAIWHLSPEWGLAADAALDLSSGQPVRADLLLSWKKAPLYLHALLRGIPAGLQLQVRFELE